MDGIGAVGIAAGVPTKGVEIIANSATVSTVTVYRWTDPDFRTDSGKELSMPATTLHQLADRYPEFAAVLADHFAVMACGVFHDLDETPAAESDLGFFTLVKEAGEAIAATAEARADGMLTRPERAEVRKQLGEMMRAAAAFDRWLAQQDGTP